MKNMVKLQAMLRIAGIIALTAVIVCTMAACTPEEAGNPTDPLFPAALAGTALADTYPTYTTDGGITWERYDGEPQRTYSVRFVNVSDEYGNTYGWFPPNGEEYILRSVNGDSYTVSKQNAAQPSCLLTVNCYLLPFTCFPP
jgi:hypothetical protein